METPKQSVAELVRGMFRAYEIKDRNMAESLVSAGFRFSSPYDDRISRKEYFERCWPNSERITGFDIQSLLAGEAEAFVLYNVKLASGMKFRNAEHFRIENGKIVEIEVFFGDPPAGVSKESWRSKVTALQPANSPGSN